MDPYPTSAAAVDLTLRLSFSIQRIDGTTCNRITCPICDCAENRCSHLNIHNHSRDTPPAFQGGAP